MKLLNPDNAINPDNAPDNAHDFADAYNHNNINDPNASPYTIVTDFGRFDRNNATPGRLLRLAVKLTF